MSEEQVMLGMIKKLQAKIGMLESANAEYQTRYELLSEEHNKLVQEQKEEEKPKE